MKVIKILICIFCCIWICSCSLLEVDLVFIIILQLFWKILGDVKVYFMGIYNKVCFLNNIFYYGEDWGDVFKVGEIGFMSVVWVYILFESNVFFYCLVYNIIYYVNFFFNKIESLKFINEIEKNCIKVECYFLRVYIYFFIVCIWGDVFIIIDFVFLDNVEFKFCFFKEDVMKLIFEDIEQFVLLFLEDGYINKNLVLKLVVYVLKVDVLMWKVKVLNGGNVDLEEVIKVIDQVGGSGVFLLLDYVKVFVNDNKKNNEIIFFFYFECYEIGNFFIVINIILRIDNLLMVVNLVDVVILFNQSCYVYVLSDKVRELYFKYLGDRCYKVVMIDLVDKDGNLILIQINKFRGKVYFDDCYFDDDLIVYCWGDFFLLCVEVNVVFNKIFEFFVDLNEVCDWVGLEFYDGLKDKIVVEKEICDECLREFFIE